jgi:uncharacterized membrane protein YkoI
MKLKRDRTPERGMKLLRMAKVRAARAARVAVHAVKSAELRALELDRWRGGVVWDAELTVASGTDHDIKVNARTGRVVSKEIDD